MAQTLGGIQRKIKLAKELQQVVETMKTMASVNIGIFEKVDNSLSEYYETIELGLIAILHKYRSQMAFAHSQEIQGRVGVVVFGADQGMVGDFNDYLAAKVVDSLSSLDEEITLWCVGERVGLKVEDKLKIKRIYRVPDTANAITSLIGEIMLDVVKQEEKGKISRFMLYYNKPSSGSRYETVIRQLLPFSPKWLLQMENAKWPTRMVPQVIEGNEEAIKLFVKEYLFITMCWACAESLVSENIARLSSMQRAKKNIDDILNELTTSYNQERQNSITEELFDVIFGYTTLGARAKTPR